MPPRSPIGVSSPAVGFFVYADGLGPGLAVTKGDELGHVEMLGVRHDVRAPRGGMVRNLVAESGEAVEYGQVVVELEPGARHAVTHALLFSPQGSQAPGMGRELAERSAAARAVFDEADSILGWSVSDLCWNGPAERLDDTRQTQPCLLATSVAALRALSEAGAHDPVIVAGHSVGEYAALVAAGVLELGAALRLVSQRAELMASADDGTGGMAAVIGLDRERVEIVVDRVARPTELVVANDNAPGPGRDLGPPGPPARPRSRSSWRRAPDASSGSRCRAHSTRRSWPVSRSSWRRPSRPRNGTTPLIPVVSNVTAEPLTDAGRIRALLAEQVRSPVRWVECVDAMVAEDVEVMIECGAGAALAGMVKRIAPAVRTATVTDGATLDAALALLAAETVGASA